jgi:hypothetical protein
MLRVKSLKILSLHGAKLPAVKAVKDVFNFGLKEALDFVNEYAGTLKKFELGDKIMFRESTDMGVLLEYMDLELEYHDSTIDEYSPTLSATEQEALDWYENADALTKLMVDNYISARGLFSPCIG